MTMTLANTEKLKEDKLKVLDLLNRQFEKYADEKAKKGSSTVEVPVYIGDLNHYEIKSDIFSEIIFLINKSVKDLKITGRADEDEINSYFHFNQYKMDEPSAFDVRLPVNFKDVLKKLKQEINGEEEGLIDARGKVHFDARNARVIYGDVFHAFQKGLRDEKVRLKLFKELWSRKSYKKKGKVTRQGEMMQAGHLAGVLNISSDAYTFSRNKNLQEKLFGMIKDINRVFRDKKIPIKIKRKNGVQLIVDEK